MTSNEIKERDYVKSRFVLRERCFTGSYFFWRLHCHGLK